MFSKAGDRVDRDLHIRDIVESNLEENGLQVKYPVCFECFDKILANLDEKTKEKENQSQIYGQQLNQLEQDLNLKISQQERNASTEQEREKAKLEAELAELDKELQGLELEEKKQLDRIDSFKSYKNNIQKEENHFWTEFNEYEK